MAKLTQNILKFQKALTISHHKSEIMQFNIHFQLAIRDQTSNNTQIERRLDSIYRFQTLLQELLGKMENNNVLTYHADSFH